MKAADFGMHARSAAAFVATNSICQGQQVPFLWPLIFATGQQIAFAHTFFKWANLASHNAGVTVVIVGISRHPSSPRRLFTEAPHGDAISKEVANINAYLVAGPDVIVKKAMSPLTEVSVMDFGNKADDGGYLTLTPQELEGMALDSGSDSSNASSDLGNLSTEKSVFAFGLTMRIWRKLARRGQSTSGSKLVREARSKSRDAYARSLASRPHQFKTPRLAAHNVIITPRVSSENRPYLPVGYLTNSAVIGDRNFALYDAPLWNMALIASRLHWVWIGTVCVRMRTDFSYSNTLGWNTFPVPTLTEQNKADLTRCAKDILLAREAHFPATIADLYDPEAMPANLREAHDRNDETLERIYIGRRFKNDTERPENWIWCEHALTVGYRSSLTEIVQIIGRATRDAPGKTRARFTNLIAEPDATEAAVTEAVNDTLKAIAVSLLMEQVLAPRFEFKPKHPNSEVTPGFDYGENGYHPGKCNVGANSETGQIQLEIKGLAEPKSKEAERICREDLNELITAFVQDKQAIERGMFDEELVPEELTQVRMGKIVKEKFPNLDEEDQEAVRQHAIAALNLVQQAKKTLIEGGSEESENTSLIDGVRKFALSVTELDMDLIDRINPFGEAYAILAKSMTEDRLKEVAAVIAGRRINLSLGSGKGVWQGVSPIKYILTSEERQGVGWRWHGNRGWSLRERSTMCSAGATMRPTSPEHVEYRTDRFL